MHINMKQLLSMHITYVGMSIAALALLTGLGHPTLVSPQTIRLHLMVALILSAIGAIVSLLNQSSESVLLNGLLLGNWLLITMLIVQAVGYTELPKNFLWVITAFVMLVNVLQWIKFREINKNSERIRSIEKDLHNIPEKLAALPKDQNRTELMQSIQEDLEKILEKNVALPKDQNRTEQIRIIKEGLDSIIKKLEAPPPHDQSSADQTKEDDER